MLSKTIDSVSQPSDKPTTETGFLKTFLSKRRDYLEALAKKKREAGDTASAKLLENSATYRISALENMLTSASSSEAETTDQSVREFSAE